MLCDYIGGAKEYGVSVNNSYQPQEKQLKRFINKINVEKYEGPTLPNHAANMLIESSRKFEAKRYTCNQYMTSLILWNNFYSSQFMYL